jgi:hypothetical protein
MKHLTTNSGVETKLLEDLAADLGNGHLERDLVLAIDLEQVNDLGFLSIFRVDCGITARTGGGCHARGRFTTGQEDIRQPGSLSGILWSPHRAGEHDVVRDDLDFDVGIGKEPGQMNFKAGNVALDLEFDGDNFLAAGSENKNIGLTNRLAEQR